MQKNKRKYICLFFLSIIIHWIIVFFVYLIYAKMNNISSNFFDFFYRCYVKCGDTPHYLYIAENWYPTIGSNMNIIVFFPLYPVLMKILSILFHDYFLSGVIISNICMGISTCLLYFFAKLELKDENKAYDSVFMFLLYPFSIFLITVFTESLFIMLSLLCLIFIKKKNWLLVGIFGMLATLTRLQGIIFIIPACYQIITSIMKEKKFNKQYFYVLLLIVGFGIYLIINKTITGNYFSFLAYEKIEPWYNVPQWISDNLAQHYHNAFEYFGLSYIIYWPQLVLFFITIFLLFLGLKNGISRYIIIYGACYLMATYLHGWMISGPRYILSCIPIYIIFPTIKNEYIRNILLSIMGILTIFYTFCSIAGHAIM